MGDTVDLPEILAEHRTDDAAKLLHRYYTEKTTTGSIRTGAHFDTWAGGGDARDVVNTVTADDLLALSLLSVEVKGPAVIGLLETHAADITRLLEQIPADLDMAAVRPEDYAGMYGKDSAAHGSCGRSSAATRAASGGWVPPRPASSWPGSARG